MNELAKGLKWKQEDMNLECLDWELDNPTTQLLSMKLRIRVLYITWVVFCSNYENVNSHNYAD